MKVIAVLIACLLLIGCAFYRTPPEKKPVRGAALVICIFARCEVTQETPTPPPIIPPDENAPNSHASRLGPGARVEGIGPNKP